MFRKIIQSNNFYIIRQYNNRNLGKLIEKPNINKDLLTSTTTSSSSSPSPIIHCRRSQFNLYKIPKEQEIIKFGKLPLCSDGWPHRKSIGDYFIVYPNTREKDNGDKILNDNKLFTQLNGIDKVFIDNLSKNCNIIQSTSIQHMSIPEILYGNHTLIAAETGCGKTITYLLPILQKIYERKINNQSPERTFNEPLALVLVPGRELATQIGRVAEKICENTGLKIKVILGGRTKQLMLNPNFEDIDLLIGTIGAISKLVTTGVYRMRHVQHVILDEADTLLDDSFKDKLGYFLKKFPFYRSQIEDVSDRIIGCQLILVSATMPLNINEMLQHIIDPNTVQHCVSPNLHRLLPHVPQRFLRIGKTERSMQLLKLVKSEITQHHPVIIFSNKSQTSDYISMFLNDHGIDCTNLNGDMIMPLRIGKFEKFQDGEVNVLSSTDIGSRGLDTIRAKHIINFDFPLYVADYIHRIGRTGRVGGVEQCVVTNFISSIREIHLVKRIEHAARTQNSLQNVDGNITGLIQQRILHNMEKDEKQLFKQI